MTEDVVPADLFWTINFDVCLRPKESIHLLKTVIICHAFQLFSEKYALRKLIN